MFERRDKSIPISIVLLFLVFCFGCIQWMEWSWKQEREKPCSKEQNANPSEYPLTPGIYSRDIGSVSLDNQTCRIIETYHFFGCSLEDVQWCKGKIMKCKISDTLTRVTLCPNFKSENQVDIKCKQSGKSRICNEEIK